MMESYTISLTKQAINDLDKISTYITEQFGSNSAQKAMNILFKRFRSIVEYPRIGRELNLFNIELADHFLYRQ